MNPSSKSTSSRRRLFRECYSATLLPRSISSKKLNKI